MKSTKTYIYVFEKVEVTRFGKGMTNREIKMYEKESGKLLRTIIH